LDLPGCNRKKLPKTALALALFLKNVAEMPGGNTTFLFFLSNLETEKALKYLICNILHA
jgi:hypothetical protein